MKKLFGFLAGLVLLAGAVVAYAFPPENCVVVGQHMPDNMDRHVYYICNEELIPIPFRCPGKTIWHENWMGSGACIDIEDYPWPE